MHAAIAARGRMPGEHHHRVIDTGAAVTQGFQVRQVEPVDGVGVQAVEIEQNGPFGARRGGR